MSALSELERLDSERPTPPQLLYKYVVPERVDVLQNAKIRFTTPLNTNDIFEIRQTFDLLMGPKLQGIFHELKASVDLEEALASAVNDSPLRGISNETIKALYAQQTGGNYEADMRGTLSLFIDQLPAFANSAQTVNRMLERMASNQMLLSLSERPDSSTMWAHYAANSSGLVIAFDTNSDFFRRGENRENQGLHKVQYFDGRVHELVDNPYAALISKQADWSYEREWRLYVKTEEATETILVDEEQIHLVAFPSAAIQRVILGAKASEELSSRLAKVLKTDYPIVPLTRMQADRATATLTEVLVS